MIENIIIYQTSNEIHQIVKIDNALKFNVYPTCNQDVIDRLLVSGDVGGASTTMSLRDVPHKLCTYDLSELEHLETECDDIYHVPNKLLLINECNAGYTFDEISKEFIVSINLGTPKLPDRDKVNYILDYKYRIDYGGAVLYVGVTNPYIKVLKYGSKIL